MKLVGFNFLKINAEKISQKQAEKLNVNTNIDLSDISEVKSDLFNSKEAILGVKFKYEISYEPKFANIVFTGIAFISISSEESADILKQWKKKQIPEEFKVPLFNIILKKANLRALQLEDELGLPPHIPMPSLKKQ